MTALQGDNRKITDYDCSNPLNAGSTLFASQRNNLAHRMLNRRHKTAKASLQKTANSGSPTKLTNRIFFHILEIVARQNWPPRAFSLTGAHVAAG
jgi:hypothetical protein